MHDPTGAVTELAGRYAIMFLPVGSCETSGPGETGRTGLRGERLKARSENSHPMEVLLNSALSVGLTLERKQRQRTRGVERVVMKVTCPRQGSGGEKNPIPGP